MRRPARRRAAGARDDMASCPELYQCGLHRNISMKEALRVWQSFYCEGAFGRCERFKLTNAGMAVPEKLLPNGRLVEAELQTPAPVPPGSR